ncbi:MAG: ribokinase [Chloroflexi bacterium]|nr:MAG: ribokinase [Chloroflexota bacterium]
MTPKKWDVVVVGGANYDYLVRGSHLPGPGDTVQGETFQEAPGGKGANQAVAAARLGARVAFVARIGTDPHGDQIMERLAAEGVNTTRVIHDSDAPTGVALVQVSEQGEKQILVAPGANRRLNMADIERAAPALETTHILLTQLEISLESVKAAVRLGGGSQAQIVLDPAPPLDLPDEFLRMVDVVKPNAGEAESLTGVKVQDRNSARKAAQQLLERGVKVVAIQAGDEGDLLVWPEREQWLPRLLVESVDATGAGDAFAAALAVALAEGRPLAEAGLFANAAAALTTTKLGAQTALPRRQEVQTLLARSTAG